MLFQNISLHGVRNRRLSLLRIHTTLENEDYIRKRRFPEVMILNPVVNSVLTLAMWELLGAFCVMLYRAAAEADVKILKHLTEDIWDRTKYGLLLWARRSPEGGGVRDFGVETQEHNVLLEAQSEAYQLSRSCSDMTRKWALKVAANRFTVLRAYSTGGWRVSVIHAAVLTGKDFVVHVYRSYHRPFLLTPTYTPGQDSSTSTLCVSSGTF